MNLKIVNIDHHNTLPGGLGQLYDRACVLDLSKVERHPLTGQEQPVMVYIGTLEGAHKFVGEGK